MKAPKLDRRSREDVINEARDLARRYVPDWAGVDDKNDPRHELIVVFARLMEILIERFNRVPDKHFLSFLDMVGVEQQPGKPAKVPVTFLLSNKEPNGNTVPAGTQAATTQTETVDAQVFETLDPFFATPAKLRRVLNVIPGKNAYSELALTDLPPDIETLEDVSGDIDILSDAVPSLTPFDNVLYLCSESLFGRDTAATIVLAIETAGGTLDIFNDTHLRWKRYDEDRKEWVGRLDITYQTDTPQPDQVQVTISDLTASGKTAVDGKEDNWLACHFKGRFDDIIQVPSIRSIRATLAPAGAPAGRVDAAFRGTTKMDLDSPFLPFGERPRYGDVLYLASKSLFSPEVEAVTLDFQIDPYTDADLSQLFLKDDVIVTEIDWQYLDTDGQWHNFKSYRHTLVITMTNTGASFAHKREKKDPGQAYQEITTADEDGTLFGNNGSDVSTAVLDFAAVLDNDPEAPEIGLNKFNDLESYWLRAIIRSKNPYGREMTVEAGGSAGDPPIVTSPTLIPPVVEKLSVSYDYKSTPSAFECVKTKNNFEHVDHTEPLASASQNYQFPLFIPLSNHSVQQNVDFFSTDPAVYMGFDKAFDDVFVSILFHLQDTLSAVGYPGESGNPLIVWEYVDPSYQWNPIDVEDGTADLKSSGIVGFTGPGDSVKLEIFQEVTAREESPGELYWYRARLAEGFYDHPPNLRGIYLNLIMTENIVTRSEDLILGSANGSRSQIITAVQTPILKGDVWVREPEMPPGRELTSLLNDYMDWGDRSDDLSALSIDDFIDVRPADVETEEGETWVRWIKVPNFLTSSSQSRHYTLDRINGTVTFGDGQKGVLPPVGTDNIVLRAFQVGGGEAGNRRARPLAVKELKSSLPFVSKIFNVQSAVGGADQWSLEDAKLFGPQTIKNKGRAVTSEDYEWMTLQAFSQVARVRCLPTRAPGGNDRLVFKPGAVTLIIVPKSRERFPQPPKGLLQLIENYLREKALGNIQVDIYAVGPEYVEVTVNSKVKSKNPGENSLVERRLVRALENFFHPLFGGEQEDGWEFGRNVYKSEIFAVLEKTQGVAYVESVDFIDAPGVDTLEISDRNLVASGIHRIQMV